MDYEEEDFEEEDIYRKSRRDVLLDDDVISDVEDAFMQGYEDDVEEEDED